jgi:hypothetical protein
MLFWNIGMFEGTLEGISERPVAECTAVQEADARQRRRAGVRAPASPGESRSLRQLHIFRRGRSRRGRSHRAPGMDQPNCGAPNPGATRKAPYSGSCRRISEKVGVLGSPRGHGPKARGQGGKGGEDRGPEDDAGYITGQNIRVDGGLTRSV